MIAQRLMILSCVLSGSVAAHAQQLLRYGFQTGDWFIYERRVAMQAGAGPATAPAAPSAPDVVSDDAPRAPEQIEIWCLEAKLDENLMLVDHVPAADRPTDAPRGVLARVDQRGLPTMSGEMLRSSAELEFLFDVLPIMQSPFDAVATWRTTYVPGRTAWRCRWVGPDTDVGGAIRIDFVADDAGGIVEICGYRKDGSYWFDPRRGVVQRIEFTEQQIDGRRARVVIALKHHVKNDEKWCAQRIDEAAGFLRRARHQESLLDGVLAGDLSIEDAISQNSRSWTAFQKDLHARVKSPFQSLAEGRIRRMQQAAPELLRLRNYVDRVRGKPASSWSLQDAAGVTQNSEMLRRGWTVECFWSGRNLASLRMVETLRQLRAELARAAERAPTNAGRQMAVTTIGLNVDSDPEFAKRAITRCGGGMPQLIAESLIVMDAPPELPYVRLIDPSGRVRAVYLGWRPSLLETVQALILGQ